MASSASRSSRVRLPGVGDRLDVSDTDGRALTVVRRLDGHVELHQAGAAPLELDPATARTVGAFVSGHYAMAPEIAERVGDALGGLTFDWVQLRPGAPAVGRSIAELAVRARTGVTIVAILRGSLVIVAPDPEVRFETGDEVVIACRDADMEAFSRFMNGER